MRKNLTKKHIAKALAEKEHMAPKRADSVVNTFFEVLTEMLAEDFNIEIRGVGSFKNVKRKQKVGHNFKTGGQVILPARRDVKFCISPNLQKKLDKFKQ